MAVTRQSLHQTFKLLNDDELLALVRSGELTELAKDAAEAELRQRGVNVDNPRVAPAAVPAATAPDEPRAAVVDGDFVAIATFYNPFDAELLRSRLEAEGVSAMVADANITRANQLWALAVGGARVLVPESQAERAREIAKAVRRGDYRLDDQTDVGSPSED